MSTNDPMQTTDVLDLASTSEDAFLQAILSAPDPNKMLQTVQKLLETLKEEWQINLLYCIKNKLITWNKERFTLGIKNCLEVTKALLKGLEQNTATQEQVRLWTSVVGQKSSTHWTTDPRQSREEEAQENLENKRRHYSSYVVRPEWINSQNKHFSDYDGLDKMLTNCQRCQPFSTDVRENQLSEKTPRDGEVPDIEKECNKLVWDTYFWAWRRRSLAKRSKRIRNNRLKDRDKGVAVFNLPLRDRKFLPN